MEVYRPGSKRPLIFFNARRHADHLFIRLVLKYFLAASNMARVIIRYFVEEIRLTRSQHRYTVVQFTSCVERKVLTARVKKKAI
jgi:hypothetical protein